MKKFLATLAFSAVFFSACTPTDLIVDRVETHNGLVSKMDAVFAAEEMYWDTYIAMEDGNDGTELKQVHNDFVASVDALNSYYEDTTFHSTQQIFVEAYEKDYKPYVDEYVVVTTDFVADVMSKGYSFDTFSGELDALDKWSQDYVDVHNKLIGIINVQADTPVSAGSY